MIDIDMYLIAADFEAARTAVYPNEISGFGFVEIKNTSEGGLRFIVYDWVLLDVGTFDYTVITPDQVQSLREHPNYKDLRIWLHSHPMGNGSPGAHNWSPMDERTIQKTPLGGPPELVKHSRLEIAPVPCTEKATIYTASFCAGWVGLMIRKIVTDQPVPRMIDHNIIDMNVRMMNEHCFGTETARSKP